MPQDSGSTQAFQSVPNANEEISAADYDPSADRQAEEIRRHQNETERQDATVSVPVVEAVQPKVEEAEEEDDDDDDDMFSDVVKVKKPKPVAANGALAVPVSAPLLAFSRSLRSGSSLILDLFLSPPRSLGSVPSPLLPPRPSRTTGTTRTDTIESLPARSSTTDATRYTPLSERVCSQLSSRLEFSREVQRSQRGSTSRSRSSGVRSRCEFFVPFRRGRGFVYRC